MIIIIIASGGRIFWGLRPPKRDKGTNERMNTGSFGFLFPTPFLEEVLFRYYTEHQSHQNLVFEISLLFSNTLPHTEVYCFKVILFVSNFFLQFPSLRELGGRVPFKVTFSSSKSAWSFEFYFYSIVNKDVFFLSFFLSSFKWRNCCFIEDFTLPKNILSIHEKGPLKSKV